MVGRGESVHEVGKGSRQHLEEGVADRISKGRGLSIGKPAVTIEVHSLLTSAKRCMFEDVRHASVVGRIGLESDGEDIVRIVSRDVEVVCARLVMLELQCRQLQLGDLLDTLESKAMEPVSHFGEARRSGICTCDCSICPAGHARRTQTDGGEVPGVSQLAPSRAQHGR